MPAIFFADLDALRLALASGAVPPAVSRAPARAGFDAQGRLWLEPAVPPGRDAAAALARLGAAVQGTSGADLAEQVSCWPQLLPLQPAPLPPADAPPVPVLFELPDGRGLAALAAEARRLGAGRVGVRWTEGEGTEPSKAQPLQRVGLGALLLVVGPPYYSLLRAAERDGGPRAYVEQAERVWVELGHRHPLADQVRPPPGCVVLIGSPRAWRTFDDTPFNPD